MAPSFFFLKAVGQRSQVAGLDEPSEICIHISDMDLRQQILDRIGDGAPAQVWTPVDFLDLGSRDAVDKSLQRLAGGGQLRRIDRGLYDVPRTNALTRQPSAPDYRHVLDAVSRRDQTRMLVDGLTAANDLGLTTAVPARIVVHTDARRRSIQVGRLVIDFKQTAPSKLKPAASEQGVGLAISYSRF